MNKKTFVFGVLCSMSLFTVAQQQTDLTSVEQLDEVVITDSKFNLKRENSGKVITKITQKELEQLQGKSLAEIINTTTGIEINGANSNAGQNLNYYVRGGKNRQVLILIDGIVVSDPSQIANDYDLRLLNANQVESIEILKGASSTLYGSGAATAVINIKLKEASKKAISANFRSLFGTNQSQDDNNYAINNFQNNVSINGTLDNFNYLASFGNQYTDGLSSLANGTESDAFNVINGNLKLGYKFSDAFKLTVYGSWDKFKADFDDGFSGVDTNDLSTTEQLRYGLSPEYAYKNGSVTLNAAYNKVERDIESSFPALYNAESFTADVFNKYNFNDKFYTVLGLNVQQNNMESFSIPFGGTSFEQSVNPDVAEYTNIDPYANVVYISDFGLNVNAGARLNNHSEYGSHLVYSLNPSYKKDFNFGYLKGIASYSTAYITPSLYQLFDPLYGNTDLKPEENATFEVGAEVQFLDKATVSVVYFTREEKNFIEFVDLGSFVYQYQNVNEEFTASGLELVADYNITKTLKLTANATYTHVDEDLSLRIPEFKVNGLLGFQVCEKTFMSLSYQFTDERTDSFYNNLTFMNEEVSLNSYNLLDFYISHTILDNKMKLFANVTNIFNEDYQELYGYSTKGRNVNLGFSLTL
ncbi:TonB-dependent receptor plug domain-containing protein [Formosa maritima]|uniref:TonB-dependent receptor n=1 Tax=Formosa maritima TaxID=2592046 RepID=A0A5D0GB97_9FLAO|nr:TonB-dependent receptor [Formosa maritima]TYA55981.1 TonB-dependent receptor [Formosa maritima]